VAIAELAVLGLGIAAGIAIAAARRFRLAQQVLDAARANARLLELMPARPLLVWPDHRVEIDRQLLRDLGLTSTPARLADLAAESAGIEPDDLHLPTTHLE